MAIAQLSIDLQARLASFEADLRRAAGASEKAAGQIAQAFGIAKGAVQAFVGAASVGALTAFIRTTANGVDKLNDLADATGSSVENLSALEDTAARTGTSIDVVGDALVKLNKSLGEAKGDSDQARALKAIGLSAKELRQLDPADALVRVAAALGQFENDQNKAQVVLALFGKSLKEVAPLLNDLAERGKGVATVTAEQAKEAEKFNQELAQFGKNAQDANRALLGVLLPALNRFFDRASGNAKGGFFASIFTEFDANIASDRLRVVVSEIELLQKAIDYQGASADPKLLQRMADLRAEAAKLVGDAAKASAALKKFADTSDPTTAAASAAFRPSQNYGDGLKRSVVDLKPDPDVEKAADQYRKLAEAIGLANAGAAEELLNGDKLSAGQQLRLKVLQALASGEVKFGEAQRRSLLAALDSNAALEDQLRLRETAEKVRRQSAALSDRELAAQERETESRLQANEAVRQQVAEFGLTAGAIERMRIARLEDAAAQEELTILGLKNIEGTEAETAARERNVAALRDQIRLRRVLQGQQESAAADPLAGAQRAVDDYLRKVEQAGNETQAAVSRSIGVLEDDLTNSLTSGKFSVRRFVDSVIQEVVRLQVVRPLLQSIFNGGNQGQGAASAFSMLFGNGSSLNYSGQFDGFRANGGTVAPGKWAIAGERGPEPVYGGTTGATVLPNKALGGSTSVVINLNGDASERQIQRIAMVARQVVAERDVAMGRRY